MSEPIVCPDCGHRNSPNAESCEQCNFPLDREHPPSAAPALPAEPAPEAELTAAPTPSPASSSEPKASIETLARPPRRPRHRPGTLAPQSVSLWLLFAVFVAGAIVFEAVRANIKRSTATVEGSNPGQQQIADQARQALEADSTNVDARIALGNVLFDTGNWAEAIPHYRTAVRRDSTRVGALVDLGVCYYNLGEAQEAEQLFKLALGHDPHQPVALFNLGIVNERRGDFRDALRFYHRALQTGPNDELRSTIAAAVQRMQEKTGAQPAPLPDTETP